MTPDDHKQSEEVARPGIDARRGMALAVVLSGIFVTVMDNSIVNVAIPTIRSTLHASFGEAELTVASYALAFSAGMITGGRLGDIYGQRRVFMVAFAAFTLTSFVCGIAPNIQVLIAGRLLQGASAAMLSPQVFALVRMSFADGGERRVAFSAMGMAIGLANVTGLVLGGVIIHADLFGLAWRMVFLVNLPIGIAAIFLTPLVLADVHSDDRKRLDLAGVALSTLAMLLLMVPLVEGPESGWAGWPIAMLVASPIAFVGFYLHQRWKSQRGLSPLLETDLFGDRAFIVGALLILIFWGSTTPFNFSYVLLMQTGYGYSALATAGSLAILGGAFGIVSPIAGRLASFGVRRIMMAGVIVDLVGMLLALVLCRTVDALPAAWFLPSLLLVGVGMGLFMTPILNTVMSGIQDRHVGSASGILTTMQRGGNALGVAALEVPFFLALSGAESRGLSQASAYVQAFGAVAFWNVLMLLAVVGLLLLLPGRTAGASQ
ncbi:MFS transporter [Bradyrhizobium erythrophlei]|uniref:Drug resistance transporter, EmrB/QacA subfamily n=1 Tax=Bradyrhizobium erythrophlei TaxID=1437360 RepID=A0A1H4X2T1_9BRAD|nr:MFS transporter [Bradyrhizobium erythrophlei]SEC99064.1 drug resistance transporter, EmrB/QacA subfamily [Bradyrhizobium erythrophlei]